MADPGHVAPMSQSFTATNAMKGPVGPGGNIYSQQSQQPFNAGGLTNGQPLPLPSQPVSSSGGLAYGMASMQSPHMSKIDQLASGQRFPVASIPEPSFASSEHFTPPNLTAPTRFQSNASSHSYMNGPSHGPMAQTAYRSRLANGLPPVIGPSSQQHQQGQYFPHAVPPRVPPPPAQAPQGPMPKVSTPQYSISQPQPPSSMPVSSVGPQDPSEWQKQPQSNQQHWLQQQQQQQQPLQQRPHPPIMNNMATPSPGTSKPPSAKSSRNPSPVSSQHFEAVDGSSRVMQGNMSLQRPPVSSMSTPQSQPSLLDRSNVPSVHPASNQQQQQRQQLPPPPSYVNASYPPNMSMPPKSMDSSVMPQARPGGITDRRQYPQQPSMSDQPAAFQGGGGQPQWQPQQQQQQQHQNQQLPPYSPVAPQIVSGLSTPVSMSGGQVKRNEYGGVDNVTNRMGSLNMQFNEPIDLLQSRNILPATPFEPPRVSLPNYDSRTPNCNPDLFRCTLTKIPETQQILQKSRLPLGVVIHPFKDLTQLAVIQCNVIVRCRTCRTYINPFVQFVDQRRWKCNLCFRVNELAEEFQYDPISKTYGDPSRRPEIRSATIEFIAPSEYMLRPPQPAVYLFVMDVSYGATETGYLRTFCDTLLSELDHLPGDGRTRIGFMTFDNTIHFYNLAEGLSQPQMMVVSDIEDVFIPCPDNLLVNLNENKELVKDLLQQLPIQFMDNRSPDSAFGAAVQAAYKLVSSTGGRVTVMQTCLPNIGPGALKPREDPNLRAGKEVPNLSPANDFYKKLSLDCSGQQVAVDLFLLSSLYCDIATLSCISKFSGGCIHYYPGFHAQQNLSQVEKFENDLKRYLTRKVGFEAVMRIRCTKGLSIHTFHGNFFVRSTDLLSLPNINPDSGFAMQMSIEESLVDNQTACFQAALLYTSSKGERRIRVHTMCLPVTSNVLDVIYSADQQAIAALLTKMAVDRSVTSSMSDARDALLNACVDAITAFKVTQSSSHGTLMVPPSLKLLPMYILAILKNIAFRLGTSTKLDERVFAMNQMKTLPIAYLMPFLYSNMYPVHNLGTYNCVTHGDLAIPQPPLLHLSAEKFERNGMFLLDASDRMFLYVYQGVGDQLCRDIFNVSTFDAIPEKMTELPELDNAESERLRNFVNYLQNQRPFNATLQILKSTSKNKQEFLQYLIEDRTESTYSYFEFLKHLQQLVSK